MRAKWLRWQSRWQEYAKTAHLRAGPPCRGPAAVCGFTNDGMTSMTTPQLQFRCDKWTLLLDGRVVDGFLEGSVSGTRIHADYFRVEGRPNGEGLKIKFGVHNGSSLVLAGKMKIPADLVPEFESFLDAVVAAR